MYQRSHTPLWRRRSVAIGVAMLAALSLLFAACNSDDSGAGDGSYAGIIEERGFTDADVAAALKTYMETREGREGTTKEIEEWALEALGRRR